MDNTTDFKVTTNDASKTVIVDTTAQDTSQAMHEETVDTQKGGKR